MCKYYEAVSSLEWAKSVSLDKPKHSIFLTSAERYYFLHEGAWQRTSLHDVNSSRQIRQPHYEHA